MERSLGLKPRLLVESGRVSLPVGALLGPELVLLAAGLRRVAVDADLAKLGEAAVCERAAKLVERGDGGSREGRLDVPWGQVSLCEEETRSGGLTLTVTRISAPPAEAVDGGETAPEVLLSPCRQFQKGQDTFTKA